MSDTAVKWTPEQQRAIDARGKGMIVSAAAGSGKTAVLIERMIQLLSDENSKVPADRLLAVTFTNDAAAQMREKLSAAFAQKLRQDPENKWLLQQQNLLQLARISTINSFCLDLVKSNINMFELSGGLTVLEENVQTLIYERSRDEALQELCRSFPKEYELLTASFSQGQLTDVIYSFYTFFRSLPFREDWLEKAKNNFTDRSLFDKLMSERFEKAEKLLKTAEQHLELFEQYSRYSDELFTLSDYSKLYENADSDRALLRKLSDLVKAQDIDAIAELDASLDRIKPVVTTSKIFKALAEDIQALIKEKHSLAKNERECFKECIIGIKDMFSLSEEILVGNMLTNRDILSSLAKLCQMIDDIAMQEKTERNGITFSDAELMAKELLVRLENGKLVRTELAEEIRANRLYEVIFIDEFQDVNDLQELVFRVLSDTDDLNIMGRNVFVVGDVKQAIYKFRLSDPGLFIKTEKDANDPDNASQLEAVNLNCNFRSRKEVINYVNFAFSSLMTEACGGVLYDESQQLVQGAKYDERFCPAEVYFVDNDPGFKKKYGFSRENYETALIIKKMLDDKEPVFENGKSRPCTASDFCILAQTNSEIKAAAAALEAVGLRVYSKDTDGYLRSREISLVLDMLRVIDDPMNDIAFAALMLSPILSFTPDEAAELSVLSTRAEPTKHYWQIILGTDKEKSSSHDKETDYIDLGNKALQQKCTYAYRLVTKLRFMSMDMSLEDLIKKIYDLTDLMGITSLYLDADKKRANLRLLLQYAASYEQNSLEGVTGFLRYIDSVSANKSAFSKAVTSSQGTDSVYVKTYHASKGLEFPFVFLNDLDRAFDKVSDAAIMHNELGCAFRFLTERQRIVKKSIYYDYLRNLTVLDEKSERLRLLYVGCTRAREKLFLCCAPSYKSNETFEHALQKKRQYLSSLAGKCDISDTVSEANSMLDWVLISLFRMHSCDEAEYWFALSDTGIEKSDEPDPDIVLTDLSRSGNFPDERSDTKKQPPTVNEQLLRELKARADFDIDHAASQVQAASKMTVTEIVSAEHEKSHGITEDFFPNLPRLDDENDELSAAEKGTFTHKFMEVADYQKAEQSVRDELERLVGEGFFSRKEASGVYVEALEKFFSSDLYLRMKRSDVIMREKQFLVGFDDLALDNRYEQYLSNGSMLQGIADCIFKENGEYIIVDYKTDRFKDESEMMKYSVQLDLYKAAFGLLLDVPVNGCCIYSFWLGRAVDL
ncbi:MAG: UvrD-helicase domain-containing protein [Ruminococcus sp.]|nr:UvrD-helicase domain-containing protein [Ruminococcus sp.]